MVACGWHNHVNLATTGIFLCNFEAFLTFFFFFQKTEAWESEKEEGDMDEYIWEGSMSEKNALQTLSMSCATSSEEILQSPSVQEYRSAMLNLHNEGETEDSISTYKESVKKMLNIA